MYSQRSRFGHPTNQYTQSVNSSEPAFTVEQLEDRRMLAGQVNVIVAGNNITILGDNESQDVVVIPDSGFIRVAVGPDTDLVGDVDDNGRTTVGESQLNRLKIKLRGGNDGIAINSVLPSPEAETAAAASGGGINIGGKLKIVSGAGNDLVTLGPVNVAGPTVAIMGSGNDRMSANGSTFERNFIFRGGLGEDRLTLGIGSSVSFLGRHVNAKMGADNDVLLVFDINLGDSTSILWHGNHGEADSRNDFNPGAATVLSFEIVIV